MRPQNYQELVTAAKAQIINKIAELEERVVALRRLHDQFETVTDWSYPGGLYTDVVMYGDTDDLDHLNDIILWWPDIADPEGGFW